MTEERDVHFTAYERSLAKKRAVVFAVFLATIGVVLFSLSRGAIDISFKDVLKAIFGAGITTKAAGHGMGLFIVKKTLNDRGGDIDVTSSPELTEFSGWVPKEIAPVASTEADN